MSEYGATVSVCINILIMTNVKPQSQSRIMMIAHGNVKNIVFDTLHLWKQIYSHSLKYKRTTIFLIVLSLYVQSSP